jgi:excisionase family DNA binding protein
MVQKFVEFGAGIMKLDKENFPFINPTASDLQNQKFITVKEASLMMGISTRSVYGYIEAGKLPAYRIGKMFVVEAEHVRSYQRQAVGRPRERVPPWHIPPMMNTQHLTSITVSLREGQDELFVQKMLEIRAERKHHLPGTAARYIARSHVQPEHVLIIFVWRETFLPPEEVRRAALAELCADLSDIVDWDTASLQEGQVVLTA